MDVENSEGSRPLPREAPVAAWNSNPDEWWEVHEDLLGNLSVVRFRHLGPASMPRRTRYTTREHAEAALASYRETGLPLPSLGKDGEHLAEPGTWRLRHRGDPCILCRKTAAEQAPGGCPVTPEQLWSRIGDLNNAAIEAWEEHGFGEADAVVARSLEEEVRRLTRLHEVLTNDMAPAGGQS